MRKALIFSGGWSGHRPGEFAERFRAGLAAHRIEADLADSLAALDDAAKLATYDLLIPNWSMGHLSDSQSSNLTSAVRGGVGLAGIHGGAGDAFRGNLDYEWMIGGHFVGHPHVGPYTVRITDDTSPITRGIPRELAYDSEQYYLLVDPGNRVLAETTYQHQGRECMMPVAWTKMWGAGRVFYSALGHAPEEFDNVPPAWALTLQGLLWAAGATDRP